MTPPEPGWSALKTVVAEALDLPGDVRDAYIERRCPDPTERAEATRLLRACEHAATIPVFDTPAAQYAAPVLAEVREREHGIPEESRTALAGRYTIERELGRGGMATVYLARDERHGRLVALKVLRPELLPGDSPARAAARFKREIELAARLSHPHILPLHDSGEAGGLLYYITPYVDGETLRERLGRTGRPPLSETLRWLRDVARALAHAHRQGVVHRDIKPANILLNQDGDALVADFGVAKALASAQEPAGSAEANLRDGVLVSNVHDAKPQAELTGATLALGTPAYMAPEQVRGSRGTDHRADLYSFGVVAYELLTGVSPFGGRPKHEQLAAHLAEVPEPVASRQPDIPETLATLVDRLLAKRPAARPRDATEVLTILDAAAAAGPTPDPRDDARAVSATDEFRPRLDELSHRRRLQRRTSMIGVTALLAVAAGALLARGWMMAQTVSIAVLPFNALGDTADTNYLAASLSDGIGTDLGRLRRVITTGYVTASTYRGSTTPLKQIAAELQVRAIVHGSVERRDERVRVDAHLLDAEDGRRLWGHRYERPASEVLEIQRDIERAIMAILRIRPTSAERAALGRAPTSVSRAYDLYLRGRAVELAGLAGQSRELLRSWRLPGLEPAVPADNIRRAQSLYAQARDVDPDFAAARAKLARMHVLAAATYDATDARRVQARLEAEAALRLSPGLPEAHEALASYWALEGDVGKAIEELGLALVGFPNSADLHLALGSMFRRAGRFDDAVTEFDHAMRLDPRSPRAAFLLALSNGRLGRREEAKRAYDRAIALAPDYHMVRVIKGFGYLHWTGIPDTLAATMQDVPADWDPDGMATYARYTALWTQRRHADALAMLDSSRTELSRDGLVYQPISLMRARIQEALGEENLAQASYTTARGVLQDSLEAYPSDASIRVSLGLAYAGLGRRTDAVREARGALELAPVGSRTLDATAAMGGAVEVFAMAGEFDAAFDLLELLFSMPAGREVTVPFLRVWPGFDPLRSDPRFEELLSRFEKA